MPNGLVLNSEGRLVIGCVSDEVQKNSQDQARKRWKKYLQESTQQPKIEILRLSQEQEVVILRRVDELAKKVFDDGISLVVFLDKSARPFFTMFHALWKARYPGVNLPAVRFIDIGAGQSSNQELRSALAPKLPEHNTGKHLIVDDVVTTGAQKERSMHYFETVDPKNKYEFWVLLDNPEDRQVFSPEGVDYPQLPWHSRQYGTLVTNNRSTESLSDSIDGNTQLNKIQQPSFLSVREQDLKKRNVGIDLRVYLRLIAESFAQKMKERKEIE